MKFSRFLSIALVVFACLAVSTGEARAQARGRAGGGRAGGGATVGRAVARPSVGRPFVGSGRIVTGVPYRGYRPFYRPYYYPYRSFGLGFYTSFGYPYGYPYYGFGYAYPYPYYGYGYGAGYGYGGGYGYGYGYPMPGYGVGAQQGVAYGGLRIQGAPRDAQVFVDGYYAGIAGDFDGSFRHLNLEAGVHQIEIRLQGQPPIAFEVNIQPGQTVTYHAR